MYGIINKQDKKYFAGFTKTNKPSFTSQKRKAWSAEFSKAKSQALLFRSFGIEVQQKPVAL